MIKQYLLSIVTWFNSAKLSVSAVIAFPNFPAESQRNTAQAEPQQKFLKYAEGARSISKPRLNTDTAAIWYLGVLHPHSN